MEIIRVEFELDDKNRYCLAWSAPNEAGCPPKGKRRKSIFGASHREEEQGKATNHILPTVLEV
jgi:hypothetical protein